MRVNQWLIAVAPGFFSYQMFFVVQPLPSLVYLLEKAHEQIQKFGEEVVQPIHKKYPAPDHPAIPAACRW